MTQLDEDRCYAAAASRDARFDGRFVTAVRTTGIYCRPSCPAITPKRSNVEFHATAAAAQQRGFRACKRCLPDATPGSPEWNIRRDVVARAMRLIADGEIERTGVDGLARRLGYSTRHVNRLLTDDLGAGPLAIARAQRAHTARILIETTSMRLTDVAFAAGFGSIRQFNDTMREVYAAQPSELRAQATRRRRTRSVEDGAADTEGGAATHLRLRLPYRGPLAAEELFAWFSARAVAGVESVETIRDGCDDGDRIVLRHRRTVRAPRGPALVSTTVELPTTDDSPSDEPLLTAEVTLADPADLAAVVRRVRSMYDLDADPVAIDRRLAEDPVLAPLVARRPGLRSPGSVDPFETAIRAVIGQQISVSAAATVTARLVDRVGTRWSATASDREAARHDGSDPEAMLTRTVVDRLVPSAEELAAAPDEAFAMPASRRSTLRGLATAVADGQLVLDAGADVEETRAALRELPGIGPWTADYIALRGLADPDIALPTDLVVVRAVERLGLDRCDLQRRAADRWAPWRSYAMHHLWESAADQASHPTERNRS